MRVPGLRHLLQTRGRGPPAGRPEGRHPDVLAVARRRRQLRAPTVRSDVRRVAGVPDRAAAVHEAAEPGSRSRPRPRSVLGRVGCAATAGRGGRRRRRRRRPAPVPAPLRRGRRCSHAREAAPGPAGPLRSFSRAVGHRDADQVVRHLTVLSQTAHAEPSGTRPTVIGHEPRDRRPTVSRRPSPDRRPPPEPRDPVDWTRPALAVLLVGTGVALPVGARRVRLGQLLLLRRRAGRVGVVEGVLLRLLRRGQQHHRRQDAAVAVADGAVGEDLRPVVVEHPRAAGADGRRRRCGCCTPRCGVRRGRPSPACWPASRWRSRRSRC